jgi:hypothetical protein
VSVDGPQKQTHDHVVELTAKRPQAHKLCGSRLNCREKCRKIDVRMHRQMRNAQGAGIRHRANTFGMIFLRSLDRDSALSMTSMFIV